MFGKSPRNGDRICLERILTDMREFYSESTLSTIKMPVYLWPALKEHSYFNDLSLSQRFCASL